LAPHDPLSIALVTIPTEGLILWNWVLLLMIHWVVEYMEPLLVIGGLMEPAGIAMGQLKRQTTAAWAGA